MSIDTRFALIDRAGHRRYPYKKKEEGSGRYGFVIGRDRFKQAEYTDSLERVIQAVVFEGKGARVKAVGIRGKLGNTLSLHAQQEVKDYWIAPELLHLVAGADFRPINDTVDKSAAILPEDQLNSEVLMDSVGSGTGHVQEPLSSSSHERRQVWSEEDLQTQLDRQSEIGRAGEFFAIQRELERLRQCGCPAPEDFVERVAASDVGRGYDVETTWPGQERCIEVKTSTKAGSDFFLTSNERSVLTELGDKAWLYRVQLCENGNHILAELQNPLKSIGEDSLTPVVWRVKGDALRVE